MEGIDWPMEALSMHIRSPSRIIKGNNSLIFHYKYLSCKPELMKFHQWLFKTIRQKSVTDRWMPARTT